ncbi:MAG TPA: HAMP domain-containing sensor histidine kinase [Oscillospiraceae bacterium]|nr:HAMP domain-containing sensor histidine kinase [Oscillospiraceae bacterium]
MRSIKHRMVLYFMFIIIITVIIFEFFLITSLRKNYYQSLEDSLLNQLQTSAELYGRYFSDASLEDNILNNVDTFWKQVPAQVEIIDMEGQVLMNSLGTVTDPQTADVQSALQGTIATWIGRTATERVMAAAIPLQVEEEQIGVLRFIASLREVNAAIISIAYKYFSFGGIVILFTGLVSLILANTITVPLNKVTQAAEIMAAGNFEVECAPHKLDEINKLSATLNYLAGEIVKKDALKNNFISSVSHELRTPLTSIKGWAVTLQQGYENIDQLQDGLTIIEKESDRLTQMVTELLDFSKFISGKITLKIEKVHLPTLLKHLHLQLSLRASREELNFHVSIDQQTPYVCTDGNRLKQVLLNLLDNAFKFTPAGGTVALSSRTDGDVYTFTLQDTGCGIPVEELPHIKEKFFKGKSSKAQNGIGLSLADEIIRLMQGKLEITSEVGRGTLITITLPLKEVRAND